MRGKSRREQIASMSQTERDELMPLARKVRADAAQSFYAEREREYEDTNHE